MDDRESAFAALSHEVEQLGPGDCLRLVEFTADGLIIWSVRRDQAGTPRCYQSETPWPVLDRNGELSEPDIEAIFHADAGTRVMVVHSAGVDTPAAERVLGWYHSSHPYTAVLVTTEDMTRLLRRVISNVALTQWYELVTLRPSRTRQLHFTSVPLFPPGATRDDSAALAVRCEPSDEHGTVFAVVAQDGSGYTLVSAQSAVLPPGRYAVTAVLVRPGRVRFHGLPVALSPDSRPWRQIVSAVPERLPTLDQPVHLIYLIEMTGTEECVRRRVERVEQLVLTAADKASGPLYVSVISYGSHAVTWAARDEAPTVWAWAADIGPAVRALRRLEDHGPAVDTYPRAAQLECALAEVSRRLEVSDARLGLVSVGSRPPHPDRMDMGSRIIPCPHRVDWRRTLYRLMEHPGIAFGAVTDSEPRHEIWPSLGRDAIAQLEVMDAWQFNANLGLLGAVTQPVPFPLLDPDGS